MKLLLTLFLTFSASVTNAQQDKGIQLYAYSQQSFSGVRNLKKPTTESFLIYYSSAKKITVSGIWVKNNYCRFEEKRIDELPVKIGQTILVPVTTKSVHQLMIKRPYEPSPRPAKDLSKLLSGNEVVIVYKWKGKEYFMAVKKLTVLEPFIAM